MTDIEYGVHVSNKYALFLDEAPDPDDLIIHLAAASLKQASTKEDKGKKKDVLSATTKKPISDTAQFNKEGAAIKQSTQDASLKQDRTTKKPFDRSGTERDRPPKKEGESVRSGTDERGARGANRRGRGGPRGGGGFGHFDQQQQDGGENRRPRGERPPRMSGFGFNHEADNQPPPSEDRFGDRFGERFGETTAPRGRGGRGGPGRGRGRNFRRGGSGGFRGGGGGGDFGSGSDGFGTDHTSGGGGGAFGSGFGSGFGDFNAGGGFQAPVVDQPPPPPADDVFGSIGFGSGFGGTFGVSEGFGGDTTGSGNFGGYFDAGDGQSRPRGRGRGRPRGGGGRGRGRQFDRQSGSDRSGVKPTDKREGAGAHNWGASGDEAAIAGVDISTSAVDDSSAALGGDDLNKFGENKENLNDATANEDKNEPVELTYDEYLAQQGARSKPTFNVRRAGEGETDKKEWKGLVPLAKQFAEQGANEEADADEEEDDGQPRKTTVVPIQINFIDEAARGGYGSGGRGSRGGGGGPGRGGGRGSGFGRGGRDRGQSFGFGGRGFGTGANFGERRGGSSAVVKPTAPYKMDEEAFPTLAG